MNSQHWRGIRWLQDLLATRQPEPASQAERIVRMQLHIVLPAKAGVIGVALYYIFFFNWLRGQPTPHTVAMQFFNSFFMVDHQIFLVRS